MSSGNPLARAAVKNNLDAINNRSIQSTYVPSTTDYILNDIKNPVDYLESQNIITGPPPDPIGAITNTLNETVNTLNNATNSIINSASNAVTDLGGDISAAVAAITDPFIDPIENGLGALETALIVGGIGVAILLWKGGKTVVQHAPAAISAVADNAPAIARTAAAAAPLLL